MKVLLIPPTYQYHHHYPAFVPLVLFPTGFAYLASSLREAGHEVVGLNPNNIVGYSSAHAMIKDKITQAVEEAKPDLIGLGGLCTDYAFIRDAVEIIRGISPKISIVIGGGIVTHDSEYIFNLLQPDFCVIGEGEEIIIKLAGMLGNGDANYDEIPNIGYWKNGIVNFTRQDFNYKDINLLPFPDYEPFNLRGMTGDYALTSRWPYRYPRLYPKPWVIISARNCPFSCTFCIHGKSRLKYRTRSIDNIFQEIKVAYDRYHFNILTIMDELFAVNKIRMIEFCTTLVKAKKTYNWDFDWSFSTHASAALDKDTLQMAKEAGCFHFSYGVESASPRVLESMNKKTKPSQIADAIRLGEEVGLCFGGNFIFGDPAETEDTIFETVDFMVHHCLDSNFVYNAIRPYPGSKLFDDCLTKGIIKDKFDYYEHVDERPWDFPYNMTAMPDKKWFPLLDSVVAFGQLFPWKKAVSPYRYEVDTKSANSPIVLHTGKQVYKIWAKCPHCGTDIYCRELLRLNKEAKPKIEAISPTSPTSFVREVFNDIRLVRDAFVKAIRLINFYYFSFTHPVYKLLRSAVRYRGNLLWDSFFATVFFDTGCPHCNKAVKIVIPVPFTVKTFSLGEIKRRLNLSD